MTAELQNPIFTDNDKAREALEAVRWPNGPVCPHCGTTSEPIAKLEGTKKSHRPGLYYCTACKGQFTVTVGSRLRAFQYPAQQVVAGDVPALLLQEGHEQPPAPPRAWHDLQTYSRVASH